MNDPLQLLLQQAADGAGAFAPNSRYVGVGTAAGTLPDGRPVTYLRRRFLPPVDAAADTARHVVTPADRLDNLANRYLGDPELFWRICDANHALRPGDLTDDPPEAGDPRVIRVPVPAGPAFGLR